MLWICFENLAIFFLYEQKKCFIYSLFQKNIFCCFIIQNLLKIAKKKKIKKILFKFLFESFIFHFSFWPNSKKKDFYSLLKIARKKVEKYTILGESSFFSLFSGRKILKSILFGAKKSFFIQFWKSFLFSFHLFIFILAEKQKKDSPRKFIQIFFSGVFQSFFIRPEKNHFQKKTFFWNRL